MSLKTLVINGQHRYLINEDSPVGYKTAMSIIDEYPDDVTIDFVKPSLEDVLPKTTTELLEQWQNNVNAEM